MNEQRFCAEIQRWLRESGRMRELQTQLRKDLADAFTQKGPRKKKNAEDPRTAALNTLLMEHLLRNRCWLTASVFASEADFADHSLFDPDLAEGKASMPKLRDDVVDGLLEQLDLRHSVNSEELRVRYYRRQDESLLCSLLQAVDRVRPGDNVASDKLREMEEWIKRGWDQKASDEKTLRRLARLKKQLAKREEEERTRSQTTPMSGPSGVSKSEESVPELLEKGPVHQEDRNGLQIDLVEELQRQLAQTRHELEDMRSSQEKLQQVLKAQEKELASLREIRVHEEAETRLPELEAMRSSERNVQQAVKAEEEELTYLRVREELEARRPELDDFVADIRIKINALYQNSVSIDKEFSDL